MTEIPAQKNAKLFVCKDCDFKSSNKYNYNKHLLTRKHKIVTNKPEIVTENLQNLAKNKEFACICGKEYKHRQNLYHHKKNCNFEENTKLLIIHNENKENRENKENNDELKELVCKLITENNEIKNTIMKENNELRKQVTELIPKVGNNNNNNIKQKFNIQIFLNEQCKDAINMNDFIKSIQISLEQLDLIKNKGLALGLSNAIIENMNKLSVYERPLHCTDTKRETLYVKDNNTWEKDKNKTKIKKAIKDVSSKQFKALKEWMNENPDFKEVDSKQDYFAQALSIIGKDTNTIDQKVIKNLCSETYVKENETI